MSSRSERADEVVFLNDLVDDVLQHMSVRRSFVHREDVERPVVQILRTNARVTSSAVV